MHDFLQYCCVVVVVIIILLCVCVCMQSASPVQLEWLVFSKGAVLVALSVNDHTPDTPTHKVIISGHHVVPVIGMFSSSY